MIDAYCHLDLSVEQPIAELERQMGAAGVDRALIVETWSGDNRVFLEQLLPLQSARFRLAFCFRPGEVQCGSELLCSDKVRALRVKTADIHRLGQAAATLQSTEKWLLPHAESGIATLAKELLQFSSLYSGVPIYLPHMGWPRREKLDDHDWPESISALGGIPNLVVGVSAIAHFSRSPFPHQDVEQFIPHILETFGPEALVAASDYPLFDKDKYSQYMQLAIDWIGRAECPGHCFESSLFGS